MVKTEEQEGTEPPKGGVGQQWEQRWRARDMGTIRKLHQVTLAIEGWLLCLTNQMPDESNSAPKDEPEFLLGG